MPPAPEVAWPPLDGAVSRRLQHRAVRDGIRVGQAQLDSLQAESLGLRKQPWQSLQGRVTGHQEGKERIHSCALSGINTAKS